MSRNRSFDRSSERGPARRMPPPEDTAEEARYLEELRERAAPVIVHLSDGTELRGQVEYFDRDMIKINLPSAPHRVVRKSDVRYIEESPAK